MPRATTACPLRRPATHSLTTVDAIFVALAAGRSVGAAQAPNAPDNALARGTPMGTVRAADWDREPLFPIPKRRMEMPFDRAGWGSRLTRKSCRQPLAV
jgi:hypothetical protein